MMLLISCKTESEKILEKQLMNEHFDFSSLDHKSKIIESSITDGIQYGVISLNDSSKVKFWFISHHLTSDKGGTIYEFPNGEKKFISGFHCCEVQFNDVEIIENSSTFRDFIDKNNGVRP